MFESVAAWVVVVLFVAGVWLIAGSFMGPKAVARPSRSADPAR